MKTVLVLAYAQGMNGTAVHQESFQKLFLLIPEYQFIVLQAPAELKNKNYDIYLNLMPPYNVTRSKGAEGDFYHLTTDWLRNSPWLAFKRLYHLLPKSFRKKVREAKQWFFEKNIGVLPPAEEWMTVCHDLTPVISREWFSFSPDEEIEFLANYFKARHVIAVSENTKQDLIRYGVPGDKISVVYNTYDEDFNLQDQGVKPPLENYLLVVGSFEPRKNARHVYEAFLKIRPHFSGKLVFIGADKWGDQTIYEKIKKDVCCVVLEHVSKKELIGWYHHAKALVYASLYEGFGLPILEAIGCGIPVICSEGSSMPEVGQGYAEFVGPKDPSDIAEKILKVIDPDYKVRMEVRAKLLQKFSARENSKKLKAILDKVSQEKSRFEGKPFYEPVTVTA